MMIDARRAAIAEKSGSLTCTLLDRRSSVPLSGARITCVWRDNRVSRLEADLRGNFSAELPQGVYDLVISAHGYLSLLLRGVGVLGGYRQHLTRALVPGTGQDPDGDPATSVGGYVTDRLGRPAAGVTMQLNAESGTAAYTTRTDRSGAFIIHGVIPETYELSARTSTRLVLRESVPIAHVRNFVRIDPRLLNL